MKKTVKTIVKLLGSALCALLFAVNAVPGMDIVLDLPDDIYALRNTCTLQHNR